MASGQTEGDRHRVSEVAQGRFKEGRELRWRGEEKKKKGLRGEMG